MFAASSKAAAPPAWQSCCEPKAIAAVGPLAVRAAAIADGLFSGGYHSHRLGSSLDFAEHKAYSPGDDVRYLDWKLQARTDRDFVRQFEDDTQRHIVLWLDGSGSMAFGSPAAPWTKWHCATAIAMAVALRIQSLQDSWEGIVATEGRRSVIAGGADALQRWDRVLVDAQPAGGTAAAVATAEMTLRWQRRTNVLWISDFLDPADEYQNVLRQLSVRGHRVIPLQILDPAEVQPQLISPAVMVDAETRRQVAVDPGWGWDEYERRFAAHQQRLAEVFAEGGVPPPPTVRTDLPLAGPLVRWLDGLRETTRAFSAGVGLGAASTARRTRRDYR